MLAIGAIEDLLINRVKAQLPYLAAVESYQGQVSEAEIIEGRVPALRTPAVLVLLDNLKAEPGEYGAGMDDLTHSFRLVVVCRNLRQDGARRDGQGAYQILEDLRAALSGHLLDAAMEGEKLVMGELQPLVYQGAEALFITREWAVYAANYSVLQEAGDG